MDFWGGVRLLLDGVGKRFGISLFRRDFEIEIVYSSWTKKNLRIVIEQEIYSCAFP